jgi:hypothetical protein
VRRRRITAWAMDVLFWNICLSYLTPACELWGVNESSTIRR